MVERHVVARAEGRGVGVGGVDAQDLVRDPERIQDAEHLSFVQGGGHGGSHPHLAHNFLMAVLGQQPAFPDAATSANWTMVGICAHESAMKGGDRVAIPRL